MNITFFNNYVRHITPSEGCVLTFRGDSSNNTFSELYAPIGRDISNLTEIKKENIPIYIPEIKKDLTDKTVGEIQQYLILQSKILLKKFLEEQPLEFEGKLYNVSSEAQQHLDAIIKAYEYSKILNIDYVPMWNDIYGIKQPYNIDTLKTLFVKIQQYIYNFIIQQQQIEQEILNIADKITLLNYNIVYNV